MPLFVFKVSRQSGVYVHLPGPKFFCTDVCIIMIEKKRMWQALLSVWLLDEACYVTLYRMYNIAEFVK